MRNIALFVRAAVAPAIRTDPLNRAFTHGSLDGVGNLSKFMDCLDEACAFAALAVFPATAFAASITALLTRRAVIRNADGFALAKIVILRFLLRRAIGVADRNETFVTATLRAACGGA